MAEPVSPLRPDAARAARLSSVQYPEKFELTARYAEGPLASDESLSPSDRLLLYALERQARHGPCTEPRPSMWDAVAKAKWNAWCELGDRSKMEAMFMCAPPASPCRSVAAAATLAAAAAAARRGCRRRR